MRTEILFTSDLRDAVGLLVFFFPAFNRQECNALQLVLSFVAKVCGICDCPGPGLGSTLLVSRGTGTPS